MTDEVRVNSRYFTKFKSLYHMSRVKLNFIFLRLQIKYSCNVSDKGQTDKIKVGVAKIQKF